MNEYLITFSAASLDPLAANLAERFRRVLESTPGIGSVEGAGEDRATRRVSGAFTIQVRMGIAAAARDGSRLAKEALNVVGLPDAQLVELALVLRESPAEPS